MVKNEQTTGENPEEPVAPETEKGGGESVEDFSQETLACLNRENKKFFGKMSDKGKEIAGQAYEGLYKIPGVNRVVGKMEIAYNKFWINRHEKKAVKYKGEMDALDIKGDALSQSKKEIESAIADLKRQNLPGAESLQLKLKEIDRQKSELLNKKDRTQSKLEAREGRAGLYTSERDRVAEKFISRYSEKLRPMEGKLETLGTHKDELDLLIAVMEARHKEQAARLSGIEEKKTKIEAALKATGMSEGQIKRSGAIKELDKILKQGREKISAERRNIERKKFEISKKIAKVERKANSYGDKREKFVRMKEGRPLNIEVEARKRGVVSGNKEEAGAREESDGGEAAPAGEDVAEEAGKEIPEKIKDRSDVSHYIAEWNDYIREIYGGEFTRELIDQEDFLAATRLSGDCRIDNDDFRNIVGRYSKFRKKPTNLFTRVMGAFLGEKFKFEK